MRLVVNFTSLRSGTPGGDDCVNGTPLSDKTSSSIPPLHVSESGSCDIESPPTIGDTGVIFRGDEVVVEKKLPKEDWLPRIASSSLALFFTVRT